MAVTPGPSFGDTAERLISSGGNIYSLAHEPVKLGIATRGRGYWVGRKRKDEANPDVDAPLKDGIDTANLEGSKEDPQDGFDDNLEPLLALAQTTKLDTARAADLRLVRKQARAASRTFAHAVGDMSPQPIFVAKGIRVARILRNVETLSKAELVSSAHTVSRLILRTVDGQEKQLLRDYASQLAKAIRELYEAEKSIAKAILTKPQEEKDAEEKKKKEAKKPPEKAQETKVDEKGKTQYKYAKKDKAKGPQSDGGASPKPKSGEGEQAESASSQESKPLTPPPPLDVNSFASKLDIEPKKLTEIAQSMTRHQFVQFFMRNDEAVRKLKYNPLFLGQLYDTLMQPPPPPQPGAQPQAQPQPKAPAQPKPASEMAMKAMLNHRLIFTGATMDNAKLMVLDFLKSCNVSTVGDMVLACQTYYCITPDQASRTASRLLHTWEREGLITVHPL